LTEQASKYLAYPPTSFRSEHPFGVTKVSYSGHKSNPPADHARENIVPDLSYQSSKNWLLDFQYQFFDMFSDASL
jgi:hypothetical protein